MNQAALFLNKRSRSFRTFECYYQPAYKYFFPNNIVNDRTHPLHIAGLRKRRDRPKEGLWWIVSVGSATSKARVVRSWLRRRLRNAFIEELKNRGFDENGKGIVMSRRAQGEGGGAVMEEVDKAQGMRELRGSLRLHAISPLITAKFEDVKKETAFVVNALVSALEAEEFKRNQPTSIGNQPAIQKTTRRPEPRREARLKSPSRQAPRPLAKGLLIRKHQSWNPADVRY